MEGVTRNAAAAILRAQRTVATPGTSASAAVPPLAQATEGLCALAELAATNVAIRPAVAVDPNMLMLLSTRLEPAATAALAGAAAAATASKTASGAATDPVEASAASARLAAELAAFDRAAAAPLGRTGLLGAHS
jgi:hypothetical protein